MKNASLKPVIEELESLFSTFNKAFFEGKLEKPVITVSPDSTKGAYGWCTGWKAWQNGTENGGFYEINLCAEYLNRPFEETCSTLIHEMVHYYCQLNGIQDTSRGNTYHNKRFKEEAEKRGLLIDYDPKIGHSITQPAPALKSFCTAQRWRNKLTIARTLDLPDDTPRQKKPSSTRKYACPCCGQSVRATKEVRILCMECAQQMEVAS